MDSHLNLSISDNWIFKKVTSSQPPVSVAVKTKQKAQTSVVRLVHTEGSQQVSLEERRFRGGAWVSITACLSSCLSPFF